MKRTEHDLKVEAAWWFINHCKTPKELRALDPKTFGGMTDGAIADYVVRDYIERNRHEPVEDADAPRCEWCELAVPDGESAYAPYCSAECEQDAALETYDSVHPRPEEVG